MLAILAAHNKEVRDEVFEAWRNYLADLMGVEAVFDVDFMALFRSKKKGWDLAHDFTLWTSKIAFCWIPETWALTWDNHVINIVNYSKHAAFPWVNSWFDPENCQFLAETNFQAPQLSAGPMCRGEMVSVLSIEGVETIEINGCLWSSTPQLRIIWIQVFQTIPLMMPDMPVISSS